MSRKPTPEQQKIIDARGRIIVSASAGSGKTYVMIERLISFLLGKEDVRRMLAVTFTNNAAAQMRDRLRTALLKAIAAETGSTRDRLKEQLAALPLAEISTVHAFCGRLVRTYFYRAGVDPAFRIIDAEGSEGMELSARAMDAALEKAYKAPSEGFSLLLSVFYAKGNDSALRKHILSLYDFVRDFNDYRSVIGQMGHTSFDAVCDFLAEDVRSRVKELARIQDVWRDTLYCYSENLVEVTDQIVADAEAASQGGLFGQCAAWSAMEIVKRSTKKGDSIPKKDRTPEQEKAIDYYETFRSAATAIQSRLSAIGPREEEEARFASACRIAAAFGELLLSYDAEYTREKQEAGVLDYSDLEQYALTILEDPDIEKDVRERYRILFVDEYQDINPVQAAILSHLAGEEVFYVGDAKQAIYGFRGSSSEFFTQKTHELEQCYPLSQNFRSAENILRAVNAVFEPILATYEPMSGGTRYKEHKGDVCIHVLAKAGKAEAPVGRGVYSVLEHPAEGKRDLFAERVALLVERELRSVWYDVDAACEKAVKPGDIAVLCRSHKGEARLAHALLARGIPVTTSAKINICDFFEARLLLDWLSYLDNPAQDIPYVTALLSFVGGMTEAELAEIRAASDKGTTFRAACQTFRKRNAASPVAKKLAAFEERAKELRIHACVRTAADVMNELLALGLEVQIAAKEGGPDRLVRVRRLVAEGENVSVSAFLARLRAAGNRLDFAPSSGADAVQVITIHASKGLEYPVVFLTDMNHAFQFPDDKQEIIRTKEYLAAPRSYDTEKKTYSGNLLRLASITAQTARERMEECNLLYVAMTRAKYRLHILKKKEKCGELSPTMARTYAGFLDRERLQPWFVGEEDLPAEAPERRALVHRPDTAMERAVLDVYGKPYAFAESTRLRAKSSATYLLHAQKGEFLRRAAESGLFDTDEQFRGATSKEAGIAYHLFLQHVRYGQDAEAELARMVREGVFSPEQQALLRVEELREILALPCLKALVGKRVLREQTFLLRLPAAEIEEGAPADEVIFQGAIDLLAESADGYEVIDYKYSLLSDEALIQKYGVQIRLYKKAVARVMRVREETIAGRIVNIALRREIVL